MVLDWQDLSKKATDRVFSYFELFTDGKYPKRFRKFLEWYGYKFQPILLSLSSTLLLFWIFLRVYGRIGFEKTIIILMIIIIITIRTIKPK